MSERTYGGSTGPMARAILSLRDEQMRVFGRSEFEANQMAVRIFEEQRRMPPMFISGTFNPNDPIFSRKTTTLAGATLRLVSRTRWAAYRRAQCHR